MRLVLKNYSHYIHSIACGFNKTLVHGKLCLVSHSNDNNDFRTLSTLVNLGNKKLEVFLRTVNPENLQSKFKLSGDKLNNTLLKEKVKLEENIEQLQSLRKTEEKNANNEDGKEMVKLIDEDIFQYTTKLKDVYEKLIESFLPSEDFEDCNDIVVEISAGVGGLEATFFTGELRNMYCSFLNNKGWKYTIAENYTSDLGGVRQCSLLVSGNGAFAILRHEAGVHRVQRIPSTERGGRIHTSTASVAVLPQPTDLEVVLKESDLKIETKKSSGAGGQHVNTTDSAVRIIHLPTGMAVECQSERSQHLNKATALKRLKSKIFESQLAQQNLNMQNKRKLQVGTSARSEKIRTYNYRDDRITDHRLSESFHNIKQFMEGGETLGKLLAHLEKWHHGLRIEQFVDSLPSL